MNRTLLISALSVLFACQQAAGPQTAAAPQAPAAIPADSLAPDGSRSFHGLRISEAGAAPLAQLTAMIGTEAELPAVKLEGAIDACCQAKGCWMTMKLDNGQEMRVRFKDYAFFVPKTSAGKTAVIEGRAYRDTTSVEDLRHYAVDGGMSEEEAARTITEPEVAIAFEATGVVIRN